ncbi:MAG: hypothetical protein MPN21_26215 [Thermoanaerobaculia bacterium]|nr:hypothetical protein [Thermoanaerobaculia bacterium]
MAASLATWLAVSDVRTVDFAEAEYSIPTEPFRAVLHVTTSDSNGSSARSVTLYGDGSLDLVDGVQGAFTHAIGRAELERLVGDTVGHGLMELNRMATQSIERMMMTEAWRGDPLDGVDVTLFLGVDDYRRYEHRGHRPGRGVHIENLPRDPADFPKLLELRGLAKVLSWMDRMFEVAAPSSGHPDDFAAAKFTLPSDPDRVVLSLRESSMSLRVRKLKLYGDGKLELVDEHLAEYVRYLNDTEIQAVMFIAIEHGLVEYDERTMVAKKWMRFQRRPPLPAADSGHVHVVVSVDDYEHAGFEAEQAESELSLPDLYGDTRYFPEIPQFRGVAALLRWMHEQFAAADRVFDEGSDLQKPPTSKRPMAVSWVR